MSHTLPNVTIDQYKDISERTTQWLRTTGTIIRAFNENGKVVVKAKDKKSGTWRDAKVCDFCF